VTSSTTSSHGPSNEFPNFQRTGDVEIILESGSKEARYFLHRIYLSQSSGWFCHALESPSCRAPSFELEKSNGKYDMPMLIMKPRRSSSPRPPPLRPKPANLFRSLTFSTSALPLEPPDDDVLKTYSNLFRIFYNHEPVLDRLNLATAYSESKALLQLAAAYDALAVIGPRVDHHLLRFGSRLWKQIAKYPPSYLKLGYLARSRAIFAEALVHVVGQWPLAEASLRGQVPQHVVDLVEDKVDEMDETRQRVEAKLWRLTLTNSRGERVTPSVSWVDWLVMSLWRQWFAENTTPGPVGILKDKNSPPANLAPLSSSSGRTSTARPPAAPLPAHVSMARVYQLIASQAYLNQDDVKRFLKLSPELYSRDNVRRAVRRLDEMKNLAQDAVQPLTRNFLELDATRDGATSYLTCVRVLETEWPWDD
jgi:hypothetical protein